MGWDLDGRIGSVIIDGRERVGLAWVRDRARGRIVFHAMTPRESSVGAQTQPPRAEEFEVDDSEFRPVFSMSWAKRRRNARGEPD